MKNVSMLTCFCTVFRYSELLKSVPIRSKSDGPERMDLKANRQRVTENRELCGERRSGSVRRRRSEKKRKKRKNGKSGRNRTGEANSRQKGRAEQRDFLVFLVLRPVADSAAPVLFEANFIKAVLLPGAEDPNNAITTSMTPNRRWLETEGRGKREEGRGRKAEGGQFVPIRYESREGTAADSMRTE